MIILAVLIAATSYGGQVVTNNSNAPSRNSNRSAENSSSIPVAPVPSAPFVIQVEPSAQEIEAVANQEAAKAKVLGLQPDDWVAFFTLCLFISTGLLWIDTRKSANAAQAAAEALPLIERAYVFLNTPKSNIMDIITDSMAAVNIPPRMDVAISFFNGGKTPAVIDNIRTRLEFEVTPSLKPPFHGADSPDFSDQFIAAEASTSNINCLANFWLDHDTAYEIRRPRISETQRNIFFFGIMIYRDVLDKRRETSFCFQTRRNGSFVIYGGAEYNYRT